MPVPDFQTLLLPVLRLAAEGDATVPLCAERIAADLSLDQRDRDALMADGRTRVFNNRIAWAKTHLLAARLVEMLRRGVFRATDRGRAVLKESPTRVDMRLLSRFDEYLEFRGRKPKAGSGTAGPPAGGPGPEEPVEAASPRERIERAAGEIHRALCAELLDAVYRAGYDALQNYTRDLMNKMGYGAEIPGSGRVVGGPGDGGVDVVIHEDRLGLGVVCIQCKCYERDRPIDATEVRSFVGALDRWRAKKGVFVTTSRFTDPARREIEQLGDKKIVLIDGKALADLMIEHGLGVQAAGTFVLNRIDREFFEPDEALA